MELVLWLRTLAEARKTTEGVTGGTEWANSKSERLRT